MSSYKRLILPKRNTYFEFFDFSYDLDGENSGVCRIYLTLVDLNQGTEIVCTLFYPYPQAVQDLIVYQHSYKGNKLEVIEILNKFLPNYAVLAYDSPGLGNSQINFCSFGFIESKILENVLIQTLSYFHFQRIYLIGKDIGAISIIQLLQRIFTKREGKWGKINQTIKNACQYKNQQSQSEIFFKISKHDNFQIPEKNLKFEQIFENSPQVGYLILASKIKSVILHTPFFTCYDFIQRQLFHFEKNSKMQNHHMKKILKQIYKRYGIDLFNNKPGTIISYVKIPSLFVYDEESKFITIEEIQKMMENCGSQYRRLHLVDQQIYPKTTWDQQTLDVINKFFMRVKEGMYLGDDKYTDEEKDYFESLLRQVENMGKGQKNKLLSIQL